MGGTVRCGDRFGGLPVELRIDVLTYLAPSHLRACIRASPAMLAAFAAARTSLLFRAARNSIHPQAINEALLTLYSPRFKKGGGARPPRRAGAAPAPGPGGGRRRGGRD